jgi:RNA polymerase-binding transcription factor DksA
MVITLPRTAALDSARPRLEAMLEEEYEGHTAALAALLERRRRRHAVIDLESATADVRQAIADVAQALRRMAEGNYGTCELCAGDIELEFLESRPAVRYCLGCTPSSAA